MHTIETGKEHRDKLEMDIYQPFVHITNWHRKGQLGQSKIYRKWTNRIQSQFAKNEEMNNYLPKKDINDKTTTLGGY